MSFRLPLPYSWREVIARCGGSGPSGARTAGVTARSAKAQVSFDHITYATFGIDPAEFYAGRFNGSPGTTDYLAEPKNRFNIEYGRARFLVRHVKGPRVLDLGCGSAPYAQTLRSNTGVLELYGIDLDPACVASAAAVYERAAVFDLNERLPFADGFFDTVFSCDVFGHIEFCRKDHLLSEIRRVTQPRGRSVHVIESGTLDYGLLTDDPDDPIRRYVCAEGHVGIESAEALIARWSGFFGSVVVENAMLYPFSTIAGFLADLQTPDALKEILRAFDERERDAAQVALGYASDKLIEWLRSSDPTLLVPGDGNPMQRPSGLVNLFATPL